MLTITNYCEPKDIHLDVEVSPNYKNTGCIHYFVDKIKPYYSKNEIFHIKNDLLEREKICSTAIGNSIAIPHCRSKISTPPSLKIFRLLNPIDFLATDKNYVKLFFLLILPQAAKNEHFTILSGIAKLGKNAELVKKLFASQTSKDFYKDLQHIEKTLFSKNNF